MVDAKPLVEISLLRFDELLRSDRIWLVVGRLPSAIVARRDDCGVARSTAIFVGRDEDADDYHVNCITSMLRRCEGARFDCV